MTLSGRNIYKVKCRIKKVLIPLLVDDPLRDLVYYLLSSLLYVLIPLLVDDPLRAHNIFEANIANDCLNPSFSG